jgi:hypothetical protein
VSFAPQQQGAATYPVAQGRQVTASPDVFAAAFPVDGLFTGLRCLRTDQAKLYAYDDGTISGRAAGWYYLLSITPFEAVNMNQQQILNLVIENRTSDPGSPVTGQVWLRTDL